MQIQIYISTQPGLTTITLNNLTTYNPLCAITIKVYSAPKHNINMYVRKCTYIYIYITLNK